MITLSQISALFQFTYHLILSPLFLFFSEQLFDYPLFYTFLNQNPDVIYSLYFVVIIFKICALY